MALCLGQKKNSPCFWASPNDHVILLAREQAAWVGEEMDEPRWFTKQSRVVSRTKLGDFRTISGLNYFISGLKALGSAFEKLSFSLCAFRSCGYK